MSMGRPVVAARDCVDAISAVDGKELLAATTAVQYVEAVRRLLAQADLADRIGVAGRACVVDNFSWDAHLAGMDDHLPDAKLASAVAQ
jgi:polysaccharide biosynthesis protein PslH